MELLNLVDESVDYYVNPSSDADTLILFPKDSEEKRFSLTFDFQTIKEWALSQTLPTVIPLSSKEYLDWVFYDQ